MRILLWLTAVQVHPSHSNPTSAPRRRHCNVTLSHLRQVPAVRAKKHPSHGQLFDVNSTCKTATGTHLPDTTNFPNSADKFARNERQHQCSTTRPTPDQVCYTHKLQARSFCSKIERVAPQSTATGSGTDGGHECTPCGNLCSPNHFESKITAYTKALAASKLHNSSNTCGGYRR